MPTIRSRRPFLRVGAALALGVAIIVAVGVIPAVRADAHPRATPDFAIRAFWSFIVIPQVFIAAMLLGISLVWRPSNRALNLASGVFGLISFALGFFILDAAMAFLKHGPSMRVASIALFACVGFNFLIGAIAVSVSISRFSETGQA